MIIKNKLESIKKIEELGLNKFPEKMFRQNQEDEVIRFMSENPAKYYAIRDKSKSKGNFKLKVNPNDVLTEIKEYDLFTINISSINYCDNQLLVGEIEVFTTGEIYLTLSTDCCASARDAVAKPDFNFKTDIFDKQLNDIPCFDYVYKYVVENKLCDVVVEFALFDKEVGINNERIIIYELRTDY